MTALAGCDGNSGGVQTPDGPATPTDFALDSLRQRIPSNPHKTDWRTISTLALASELAYERDDTALRRKAKAWGFVDVTPLRVGSMAAFVASNKDVVLVAFCGTDEPCDWLVNLNAHVKPYGAGQVHTGFYTEYLRFADAVGRLIPRQENSGPKVWVTGHSLGGALAAMFLLENAGSRKMDLAGVVTFGQPMIMDQRLAADFRHKHYGTLTRVVNQNDVVARVPPNLEHVGHLIWFVNDTGTEVHPEYDADASPSPMGGENRTTKAAVPDALKPLTENEFEALKRSLASEKETVATDKPSAMAPAPFNYMPCIANHEMSKYVSRTAHERDNHEHDANR